MREYDYNEEKQGQQEESNQKLKGEVEAKRNQLEQWSSTAYGEVHAVPEKSAMSAAVNPSKKEGADQTLALILLVLGELLRNHFKFHSTL